MGRKYELEKIGSNNQNSFFASSKIAGMKINICKLFLCLRSKISGPTTVKVSDRD